MSRLLMIMGAVLALLGVVLIPLPGPGFLVLALGVLLVVVGAAARSLPGRPRTKA